MKRKDSGVKKEQLLVTVAVTVSYSTEPLATRMHALQMLRRNPPYIHIGGAGYSVGRYSIRSGRIVKIESARHTRKS